MLVKSNNNSNKEIDYLAIGQREYNETNPFGYKDYKETSDGWFKKVEYTDENGKKVVKEINPLGQVFIHHFVAIKEDEKKNIKHKYTTKPTDELDALLLDDWNFDDNQQETKQKKNYDWDDTPDSEQDEKNISENDFYKMNWRKSLYLIYKLLVNISSSLSNIQEVGKENNK